MDAECVFCVLPALFTYYLDKANKNLTTFQQTSYQTSRNSSASYYPTCSKLILCISQKLVPTAQKWCIYTTHIDLELT